MIEIDVQGVVYEVSVPLSTYQKLPPEKTPIALLTITYIRENLWALYGFLTPQEKDTFQLLLQVSGVGPKVAMSILSRLEPSQITLAIQQGDISTLTQVSGVGKKLAERIILELKGVCQKIIVIDSELPKNYYKQDALLALLQLGYKTNEAERALEKAQTHLNFDASAETWIKEA